MSPHTASCPTGKVRPQLLGALAAFGYWLLEAGAQYLGHDEAVTLVESLLPSDAHELFHRLLIAVLLLGIGLLAERAQRRRCQAGRAMRDILDGSGDAYLAVDGEWRLTYVNPRAEQLLGTPAQSLLGEVLWERFPGAEANFLPPLQQAMQQRRTVDFQQAYAPLGLDLAIHAYPNQSGLAILFQDITEQRQREREMSESNQRLQTILDSASEGIITTTHNGDILSFNRAAEQLFGYRETEVLGRSINMLMPPEFAEQHPAFMERYLENGGEGVVNSAPREMSAVHRDGTPLTIEIAINVMRRDGQVLFLATIRDISERKQQEHALRRSEAMLNKAQSIANIGSWEWRPQEGSLFWSQQVYRIFGRAPEAGPPDYNGFVQYVHPDDREGLEAAVRESIELRKSYSLEHRLMRSDGGVQYVHEQGEVSLDGHGEVDSLIGTVQDITERKQAQQALEYMSNYDPLTGLPNRSLLHDRLQQALHQAERDEHLLAVMFLDLDRFKTINDSLGHAVGDELLKEVARRLKQRMRQGDTVARLGGDEFVIILESIRHVDDAAHVAGDILQALEKPCHIGVHEIVIGTSIGITIYPFDDDNIDDLLRDADTAMYKAKAEGRNNYQYFSSEMTEQTRRHMELERDLRHALERDEFSLHYQPQRNLTDDTISGMEALLRWRCSECGTISPVEFIPVLEETGLIHSVGRWVLEEACRQNKAWQDAGLPPLRVAVNVSARQFRRADFAGQVEGALQSSGLEPRWLELEITESLLVEDVDATLEQLNHLVNMGVSISVDDFGTGYSSMSYLKRFPLHTLKVDQSFVRDIGIDADDDAIVRAVIAMAHGLRLKVIAEGVESEQQLQFLKALDCDHIQGYLISRPLPADELAKWLRQQGA